MNKKNRRVFREALKRYESLQNTFEAEQRTKAINDMLFVHDESGQWDEEARTKRANRPRYTIDRISGAIDQIKGDQRQSRISIKVLPRKNGSEKIAEIYTGLIRNIEQESDAASVYDNAFDEAITGGFGGWRVFYDYDDELSFQDDYEDETIFDQKLGIEPIYSAATTLFFDPDSIRIDRSDAEWAFLIVEMTMDSYKKKWPKASIQNFDDSKALADSKASWFNRENDSVKVAEYWFKENVQKEIAFLSDGRIIDLEEEKSILDELSESGVQIVKQRSVSSYNVYSSIINGVEFLSKPKEWIGKFIPLVPVFGKTAIINNKFFSRGVVRKAIDAQRIYNYATSSVIETVALSPKDPIFISDKQAEGHDKEYENFPTQNSPFLRYNSEQGNPGPPKRAGAPALQTALLAQIQQAADDVYTTTGLEPANFGKVPELKSGRAIVAQQKMGDRGIYVYRDNLAKSISHTGKILVDLIPRVYDNQRVITVLGEDNSTQQQKINESIFDSETGDKKIVNDLSHGQYNVIAKVGPSFATQKVETVEQLVTLAGQSQIVQELALDIIIKNMDLNQGEELEKRIRKQLIQKGIVQPTQEEIKELGLDRPPKEDPVNEAIRKNLEAQTEKTQIESQKTISEVHKNEADIQLKNMDAQKKTIDSLVGTIDIMIRKLENGFSLTQTDLDILKGQKVLVEEVQNDVLAGGEVAGSPPLGRPI